jgi:hypothetical protein
MHRRSFEPKRMRAASRRIACNDLRIDRRLRDCAAADRWPDTEGKISEISTALRRLRTFCDRFIASRGRLILQPQARPDRLHLQLISYLCIT